MSEPAPRLSSGERVRQSIDRRLVWQMRILAIIFLLMFALVTVNIVQAELSLPFATLGAVIGLLIGIVVGHRLKFVRDEDAGQVLSQPDIICGIILGHLFATDGQIFRVLLQRGTQNDRPIRVEERAGHERRPLSDFR